MMRLPPTADTWTPDGPPPSPAAEAAVADVRKLLLNLDAPADLVARVTTWANQQGGTWVYVPALPLDLAARLAALRAAS